jgi:hypothetical protein
MCSVYIQISILCVSGCDVSMSPICSVHIHLPILYVTGCDMSMSPICSVYIHLSILYGTGCDVSASPICSVHIQISIRYATGRDVSMSPICSVHIHLPIRYATGCDVSMSPICSVHIHLPIRYATGCAVKVFSLSLVADCIDNLFSCCDSDSFQTYEDRWEMKAASAPGRPNYILASRPYLVEVPLGDTGAHHVEGFTDTSLHLFPPSALPEAGAAFWNEM